MVADQTLQKADTAWEEACRRDDVIRELLAGAQAGGKIGRASVEDAAVRLCVSTATLYRLIRRFREQRRVSTLLPGKRGRPEGTSQISASVDLVIREEIATFYLKPERPTFQALVRQVQAQCRVQQLPVPVAATIRRRLDAVEPKRQARLRGDDKAVEAMTATPGQQITERPLDFVQIDHTQVDVMVVDEESREPIGRPWLTLGIDVCTRMSCGFSLSFQPPSLTSVSLCLLHSVYDKTGWLTALGLDVAWPVAGLPKRIGVDNATEFRSPIFEKACRDFGIKVEYRPRGAKHFGGHIERLIGTQMGAVHILPGTTHGSIKARQSYDPQAEAVMTLRELETWLALEIAGHYHQRIHSTLLRPPIAVWHDWDERLDLVLPDDRMAFWISFLPGEERALQRDGIHLFNICYWSNALHGDVGRTKAKLKVRFDPRNISRIFVERPSGHWVEARYRNLRWPAISLWEQAAALRVLRRQGREEVNEAIIFGTILRQREIVARAARTSTSARMAKLKQPKPMADTQEPAVRLTGIDLSRMG